MKMQALYIDISDISEDYDEYIYKYIYLHTMLYIFPYYSYYIFLDISQAYIIYREINMKKKLEMILIRKNNKLKFAKSLINQINNYLIFYIYHRFSKKYITVIYIHRYNIYIQTK